MLERPAGLVSQQAQPAREAWKYGHAQRERLAVEGHEVGGLDHVEPLQVIEPRALRLLEVSQERPGGRGRKPHLLDTEGIEPTAHAIPLDTPLRPDHAAPGIDPELAVANAPEAIAGAFVVPKVIEGEDEG